MPGPNSAPNGNASLTLLLGGKRIELAESNRLHSGKSARDEESGKRSRREQNRQSKRERNQQMASGRLK